MGKRHKSHGRARNLAVPLIGAGVLLLIGAVFLLSRQGADASSNQSGTPQIAVDQQKIDYGYVKFGGTRSIKLTVTNTGDGALRFEKKPYIEVLEGC
jgi:hypothetical protein